MHLAPQALAAGALAGSRAAGSWVASRSSTHAASDSPAGSGARGYAAGACGCCCSCCFVWWAGSCHACCMACMAVGNSRACMRLSHHAESSHHLQCVTPTDATHRSSSRCARGGDGAGLRRHHEAASRCVCGGWPCGAGRARHWPAANSRKRSALCHAWRSLRDGSATVHVRAHAQHTHPHTHGACPPPQNTPEHGSLGIIDFTAKWCGPCECVRRPRARAGAVWRAAAGGVWAAAGCGCCARRRRQQAAASRRPLLLHWCCADRHAQPPAPRRPPRRVSIRRRQGHRADL
jgi:hypothetical protein